MKKIKVGVLGAFRGTSMINYCRIADNAEVVAICDNWPEALEIQKNLHKGLDITYYDNFEDFINHDMDVVVLANYATEHAPFAIKAMKKGKHVISEVLPVQNMKEAVELVECVEETGMSYIFAENYCYMSAPAEMRKLYREGKIGEIEYAECEYIHNCEPIWPFIAYGDKNHWRNYGYATFYCTHSLGPILHVCGLRPVSVVGFEGTMNERNLRKGARSGQFGIEMVTLENGAIVKSIHGGLYKNSVWYSMYGSKGRMESAREDAEIGEKLYVNADAYSGEYPHYNNTKPEAYYPTRPLDEKCAKFGHGGSDFYFMYTAMQYLLGDKDADIIDVYEALDSFLPGLFAYRSVLQGGVSLKIPNLRNKEDRDLYRNDTACTDPKAAGDMLIPCFSAGNPDIPDAVYEHQKQLWLEDLASGDSYSEWVANIGTEFENKDSKFYK